MRVAAEVRRVSTSCRRLLAAGVLLLVLLAGGCIAADSGNAGGPEGSPSDGNGSLFDGDVPTPPIEPCPAGVDRVETDLANESLPQRAAGFELRTNATRVYRGETVGIQLVNVADERQYTGVHNKYVLQRRGPDGWRSVMGYEQGGGYNGTGISHDPGEGYSWRIRTTGESLLEGKFAACGSLPAGEYRVAYFGLTGESDDFYTPAVAVRFRLAER